MTFSKVIKSLQLKNEIRKNEYVGYSCNDHKVKIKVSRDGYIMAAKGLSLIMWSVNPDNINNEVIGLHVSKFAEILKENEAYPGNYDSFCKNVLYYYMNTLSTNKVYVDGNNNVNTKEESGQLIKKK